MGIDPADPTLPFAMGNAFRSLKDFMSTEEAHDQALSMDGDFLGAYNNLGLAFAKQGRLEQAVATYQKASAMDPAYAVASGSMGETLEKQGKLIDALQAYIHAISADPGLVIGYSHAASAYRKLGNFNEAENIERQGAKNR